MRGNERSILTGNSRQMIIEGNDTWLFLEQNMAYRKLHIGLASVLC